MSIHDKLIWVAVVSNAVLWGGVGLALLWLTVTDPTLPDDPVTAAQSKAEAKKAGRKDGQSRHRA